MHYLSKGSHRNLHDFVSFLCKAEVARIYTHNFRLQFAADEEFVSIITSDLPFM